MHKVAVLVLVSLFLFLLVVLVFTVCIVNNFDWACHGHGLGNHCSLCMQPITTDLSQNQLLNVSISLLKL